VNKMTMTRNSEVLFNGLTNRDEYDPDNDIHGNDPFRIEERLPRSDPLLRKGRVGGHATKCAVGGCVSGSFSVCGAVDGRHGAHGWCGGERLGLCHRSRLSYYVQEEMNWWGPIRAPLVAERLVQVDFCSHDKC